MDNITVTKRGKVYQYRFEVAPVNGKRKWISKSGFDSSKEAKKAGIIAYKVLIF